MKQLKIAQNIAKIAHKGQTYGEYPYIKHLNEVQELVKRNGGSEYLQIIAVLHDVMEDVMNNYSNKPIYKFIEVYEHIKTNFGFPAVSACLALININKEPNYRKLLENAHARSVKIADRICNIKAGIAEQGNPRTKYVKQHDEFCSLLISKKELEQYVGNYDNAMRTGARLSRIYLDLIKDFI